MSDAVHRIRALLCASDRTMWGPECGALLAEAVALADASGEEQYAYAARMRQCVNASFTNDNELLLASFAVCEGMHASDPLRFPANPKDMKPAGEGYGYVDLYWIWKWIPGLLIESPEFPPATIGEAIADLERAYRDAGLPEKAPLQRRFAWAIERGDRDETQAWIDRLAELPDDEHSDCPACARSRLIEGELLLGHTERALTLLEQIAEGGYECNHEPALAYSHCLDALAEAGQAHRISAGIDEILSNEDVVSESVGAISRLGAFLVRAGEPGRALALLRRIVHRMAEAPMEISTHESLLAALAVAARVNAAAGHAAAPVPEADDPRLAHYFGSPAGGHTLATLAEAAAVAARDLARRFDERNQTGAHTERVEEVLRDGVRYQLELTLPVDPAMAFADLAVGAESLFRVDDSPVAEPADTASALNAVYHLHVGGRNEDAVALGRRWLPRIESGLDRGVLLHALAAATAQLAGAEAAAPLADEALASLQGAGFGDIAAALAALGRAFYTASGDHEETVPETVTRLEAEGTPAGVLGFAISFEPYPFVDAGLMDYALRLLDQTDIVTVQLGQDNPWAALPFLAKLSLARLSDAPAEQIDQLLQAAPEPRSDQARAAYHACRAEVAGRRGDHAGALAEELQVHQAFAPWGSPMKRALTALGLAQRAAAAEAVPELLSAVDFLERIAPSLQPEQASQVLVDAAILEARAGRPEAHRTAEAAVSLAQVPEEPDGSLLGRAHREFGHIQVAMRETRPAIQSFLASAAAFEEGGDYREAAESALFASYNELNLGNVVSAGRIAEAVLKAVPRLTDPWAIETSARHVLADAAARAGADRVPDETVQAAFDEALAASGRAPEPDQAAASRERILVSLAEWLLVRRRPVDAVAPAREAAELTRGAGDHPRYGVAAATLLRALCILAREDDRYLGEARSLAADLLADQTLDHLHDEVTRLCSGLPEDTTDQN
ncbi:MAG: hypothetical protein Q3997_06215 [Propionibacteriaceae bacterium]|nr:hypothetical protein [Propionibacteriaceae bacterium]